MEGSYQGGVVMAVRIPWDKYETAILIDACIKVQNNILSKEIAVSEVSADLRRLAISRGYEIDDVFRNENGISMQMTIMSALLQNKPSGLHNASKLFSEIRDIYINDNDAYIQILTEAKAMINGKEDDKTLLIKYIKEKASKKADDIVFAIDKISEFAIATKVLNVSIYNNLTPEALNLLRKRVVTNKFFVVKNKKIMNNVQQAMILLDDYILSNSTTDNTEDVLLETQSMKAASTDKATSEFIIDFNNIPSLAFTKPQKFTYKEITTINISSWTDLYIKIMREFIDEFPSRLLPGINFFSGERVDLGTSYHLDSMRAPKTLTDTLYLETNLSATDIVKKLKSVMELCDVNFSNLTIYYLKKDNSSSNETSSSEIATRKRHTNTVEKDEFLTYLVEEACVSENTARSYASQVNSCETYSQEHSIGTGRLYTADTKTEAYENACLLLNNADFQAYSRISHNAPIAALRKYCEYLNGDSGNKQLQLNAIEESFDDVDFDKYQEILSNEYNKGFRLNDKLSLKRLRVQWQRYYNEKIKYDDETICKHIAHITIRHGDMAYLPQSLLDDDTKERLLAYIEASFESGKEVIYYEALYKEFADDFSSHRINNVEMLKTYLSYINDGDMYLNRSYIAVSRNVTVDHADEVRNYMTSYGAAITVDELAKALSHLPEDKIKWIISGNDSKEFVWNKKGEFLHADVVDLSQYELDLITEWISLSIADKEYMGGKELVDTIKKKLPAIMERYPFLTEYGLRDAIAYKLQDTFSFKGKIISALGQELSMERVFADYASSTSYFTLTQLNSLKNELNTPIYFDAVYQNSLRINKEEFVSREQARFDITATDSAIDRFCQGEYVAIKEISLFGAFPDAGFPWNEFLLQHYVANYSKSYKLLHAGFTAGYAVGAIVKRTSQLNTFEEVITKALADSEIALNSEDALQYLSDSGFLARRSYGNIEAVLIKANQQRLSKGD